jgi:hypothetical protein
VIRINDTRSELPFLIHGCKLHRTDSHDWNVRISGKLEHFWLLASRAHFNAVFGARIGGNLEKVANRASRLPMPKLG